MIDNEITHETLDNIIIEAISTIRRKKRPNVNSIFEHLSKELHNSNITSTPTDTRLSNLTIDGKLAIKYSLGKASYWVKDNNVLESFKSKRPTSSLSLPSPLNYETPLIGSNEHTVTDTYRCLEEKVNLLNVEIIVMKSFIEDQMLILVKKKFITAKITLRPQL